MSATSRLPPRRPDVVDHSLPWPVVLRIGTFIVMGMLIGPWLLRLFFFVGEYYDTYARWASGAK